MTSGCQSSTTLDTLSAQCSVMMKHQAEEALEEGSGRYQLLLLSLCVLPPIKLGVMSDQSSVLLTHSRSGGFFPAQGLLSLLGNLPRNT